MFRTSYSTLNGIYAIPMLFPKVNHSRIISKVSVNLFRMNSDSSHQEPIKGDNVSANPRIRKSTEKGLSYKKELLENNLQKCFRKLKISAEKLQTLIFECDYHDVQSVHKEDWLSLYAALFKEHDELCYLLSSQQLDIHKQLFSDKDIYLRSVKARVEEWFATHESRANDTEDRKSTRSSHSSKTHRSQSSTSRYSRTSSLLSAKIKEQQRKAELLARSATLK